jgi:hypothetical protein
MNKSIIVKTSAKDKLNLVNYNTVMNTVINSNAKTGIVDKIKYLINRNTIILF